ncbi:MAG: hypothetical protein M0Z44_02090, partial [Gammaproteobacteria bacterium]|nr:hypothetical protein [Gammaproteobacteria bacterium]
RPRNREVLNAARPVHRPQRAAQGPGAGIGNRAPAAGRNPTWPVRDSPYHVAGRIAPAALQGDARPRRART